MPGSRRGDPLSAPEVFIADGVGAGARVLTVSPGGIETFEWSPDGAHIAFTSRDAKTREELQSGKDGRDWVVADANPKHLRLYRIDLQTGATVLVTRADLTVHYFA